MKKYIILVILAALASSIYTQAQKTYTASPLSDATYQKEKQEIQEYWQSVGIKDLLDKQFWLYEDLIATLDDFRPLQALFELMRENLRELLRNNISVAQEVKQGWIDQLHKGAELAMELQIQALSDYKLLRELFGLHSAAQSTEQFDEDWLAAIKLLFWKKGKLTIQYRVPRLTNSEEEIIFSILPPAR